MDLSIVILNYRSKGLVKQCVKTIGLYVTKAAYEIIVVDNASGDGVGEMLAERFPEVRFIQSPANVGYAGGNNLGVRAARGRYVVIMNPDITVRPGALDAMVAYMDANADVGILGPKLVHPDGSIDSSCYRFPTYAIPLYRRTPFGKLPAGRQAVSRYLMEDYDHRETREVDWLLGAVLMVRRSALDRVGPLDERYFLYFEDTDWCRRFWNAGWRVVYYTGAEMVHYHERLSAQGNWLTSPFRRSTRIHISSCIKYFRKWGTAEIAPEKAK
ncbi:MAG TPA: glycosyltransferase family 2 protein [Patescibacteria group bacterium]|nr:glycosyltransferase family 2 protein [Patescibacteria group bacterium]